MTLHPPTRTDARCARALVVDSRPRTPAGTGPGCACSGWLRASRSVVETGRVGAVRAAAARRLGVAGRDRGRRDRGEVRRSQGRDSVFTGSPTSATSAATASSTLVSRGRRRGGAAVGALRARARRRRTARPRTSRSRCAAPGRRPVRSPTSACPGVWDHADKLICCELLTPDGNWSSYPPHKHDASDPCEVVNEEIYYYRIAGPTRSRRRATASATTDVHRSRARGGRARADRRDRRGARPRRGAGAARLPRSVRRGAGLPDVLPQRDGRARRPNARWRSATTRRTAGCATPGRACPRTPAAR